MHTPTPITGTILVIDREDRLPQMRASLEEAGFNVITAETTTDGLVIARERRPDLVLSEVMLEQPDAGFVLGYRLKADPELAQIPLMLLSSVFEQTGFLFDLSGPEERAWIKADAYLDRPLPNERLVAKVRALLQHGNSV